MWYIFSCVLFQATQNRASVVLIDRTLDLAGPAGHNRDTLADKIISVLPRLPGHRTDVTVNMASLCSTGRYKKKICNVIHKTEKSFKVMTSSLTLVLHMSSLLK